MGRPTMRFVPVKTAELQAAPMMVGVRDRLIRNRTQLSNAIRGMPPSLALPPPEAAHAVIERTRSATAGDGALC